MNPCQKYIYSPALKQFPRTQQLTRPSLLFFYPPQSCIFFFYCFIVFVSFKVSIFLLKRTALTYYLLNVFLFFLEVYI